MITHSYALFIDIASPSCMPDFKDTASLAPSVMYQVDKERDSQYALLTSAAPGKVAGGTIAQDG